MFNQGFGGYDNQGYGNMGYGNMGYNNQGYGFPQGNMGFGGYGYPQGNMGFGYQMPKINRREALEQLKMQIASTTGVYVSQEVGIEDYSETFRHACLDSGVSFLQKCEYKIPEVGVSIPFFFCMSCGKLFYLKDFM